MPKSGASEGTYIESRNLPVWKKGAGWFELWHYFRWFSFLNLTLGEESGVAFGWEGDWEDMRRYFSRETNLGSGMMTWKGRQRQSENFVKLLEHKWECNLSFRNLDIPKKEMVQRKKIQWSGIKWKPSEAEKVETRDKT